MTNDLPTRQKSTDDLSSRVANLSPARRALFDLQLKKNKEAASSGKAPISRRTNSKPAPLSFSQQRLWFLNQLAPDSPTYNISKSVRISGPLQVQALHQALETIVARHATLRTTFAASDGSPVQVISQNWSLELPLIDLSKWPKLEQETEVKRVLSARILRPFDLSADLMLRVTLLQLDQQEHLLLLVLHHIASDGWSTGVLFRELSALYGAFSTGAPAPLPDLPIQYTDFAIWQRERLQGEFLDTRLAYWRQQLDGAPPVLELPTDHPRSTLKTSLGGRQSVEISSALSESLKALSQQEEATLFMTLLAAFKILLYRYTIQENIVVGTPIANRNRIEIEGLIGFFVNTLVLHTDLSGNPAFREVLARVRDVALGAHAHQDLPFEKLVEELQPERNLDYNPLFQVMFIFQNASNRLLTLPGLTVRTLPRELGVEQFDLTLSMHETPEGLSGSVTYSADLFDAIAIERMVGHFQTLLAGVVADPDTPISQLPLLTAAERHQLLEMWNDTTVPRRQEQCIHRLFEDQVVRTPDALAVVAEGQQLAYRELNAKANQLARYLQKRGVGPETLVGICMERSLEMVVGLMGILKAGGAYIPLDPSYPEERLAFIIEDAQVPILITQNKLLDDLPQCQAQIVDLDSDWPAIAQEVQDNIVSEVKGDNAAYVMYTSGSTGKPKGVLVLHRGVCNYLLWRKNYFPLTATDRVLQKTSFSFVDSVWELFEPLTVGAQLIMAAPDRHQDTAYLVQFIAEQKITAADFIPSLLHMFLEEPGVERCNTLKRVTTGSEVVLVELQERFFARLEANLYNLYGPTEASIASTCWTCQQSGHERSVPIGRPIANTQIYLLDPHLQPVPVGLPGEVHIGGLGLARGYLNRPELTAKKFISNPFSDDPAAKLYKTGDQARYLPDGNLEFLGRIDHQVKMRGYRIELGEIRTVLNQHPTVQENEVIVREDLPGDKRLVAYLIPTKEQPPTVSELRNFLKEKLPDYMVPATFVTLDTLPLTPNGKVDRRALPAPDQTRPELESILVAPRTPVEEVLAGIWSEVLGVEQVGIYDNFFELGGHSLLATRVVSRIRDAFQVELSLRNLFETPTVEGLTEALLQTGERMKVERTAQLLLSLSQLSEDEVETMLDEKLSILISPKEGGAR